MDGRDLHLPNDSRQNQSQVLHHIPSGHLPGSVVFAREELTFPLYLKVESIKYMKVTQRKGMNNHHLGCNSFPTAHNKRRVLGDEFSVHVHCLVLSASLSYSALQWLRAWATPRLQSY